jgi:hypothetical protein
MGELTSIVEGLHAKGCATRLFFVLSVRQTSSP